MNVQDWLTRARDRADAATEGPWIYGGQGWVFGPNRRPVRGAHPGELDDLVASVSNDEDALAIAAARTDLPAALDAIQAVLDGAGQWAAQEEGSWVDAHDAAFIVRRTIAAALGVSEP